MNERLYLFITLVVLLVTALTSVWIYYHRRARKLYGQSWESILARVTPIDKRNLRTVAFDLLGEADRLDRPDGPCELEASEIVELIGGFEGLRAIQKNCDALIDLACYCQRMYPEALVVAEALRLNAREIQWHLDRLDAAARNGSSRAAFGEYAQRIAAIYYLMTRRLVSLYEVAEMPGVQEVQISLA
ncbi:MAG TPA: hypothetical protein VMD97_06530 [Candidatus Aquilonibacter sp.]|nr:hypothetical protein [Candidatus Aquilonibacter sp.]